MQASGSNLSVVPQQLKPAWLESLLSEKFFTACARHAALKKNERNIFCVDCTGSICQHCLSSHRNHKLLQVRRYVYHDVIRLHDIQKLVDCSHVQTYIINSARVVFLNQRPQPRPPKGLGNVCETCDRSLQESYRYCSVGCKVDAACKQGNDLASLLPRCNSLQLSDFPVSPAGSSKDDDKPDDEELSPNSILEDQDSDTSSGSTANDGSSYAVTSTATTSSTPPPAAAKAAPARKKVRSSRGIKQVVAAAATAVFSSGGGRRKSTPHRSPLS
ncbi:uncharacterized protein LOC9650066 [Selaginella moellendorffii]|nr:uncharacterized protein LOC9650066 [Selaginella moellendorffii]XP_002970570.2 uncharacterized protein LOC9632480 isoform X2 [Selaginella moellendorffii]XP_024529301.1 uncharacterized protein LOC9650066 [Selaginella moellendorffii]|eukprot:XP_002968409.2 uncharacterized protein LOC9650066 [Selaginella moellendorffii]